MDTSPTCAAELGGLEHAETVSTTTDTPIRAPTTRPENTNVTFHIGGRRQEPTRSDGPAQTATQHDTIRTSTRSARAQEHGATNADDARAEGGPGVVNAILRSSVGTAGGHDRLGGLPQDHHVAGDGPVLLSLIHISEPTRRTPISYAVFCL